MKRILSRFGLLGAILLLAASGVPAAEVGEDGIPYPPPEPADIQLAETKIGESLKKHLGSSKSMPVIIILANQPYGAIVEEVQSSFDEGLRAIEEEIRQINLKYTDERRPQDYQEAAAMAAEQAASITSEDAFAIADLNFQAKDLKDSMRRNISQLAEMAVAAEQESVSNLVLGLGGSVTYTFYITNAIAAQVTGKDIEAIASHPLVSHVIEDKVADAHLNISKQAILAATFWNAGRTGGVWRSATLDTGVTTNHPALTSKTWTSGVFHATASTQSIYDDNQFSTFDLQGHGTHVAGIMDSDDSLYTGVAYGSNRSMNLKAGFRRTNGNGSMYNSDMMAAVHWAVTHTYYPDVINYSFGSPDAMTSDDDDSMRFWDGVVHGRTTTVTISAGNSGPGTGSMGSPSGAYNPMIVANVNDQNTATRADDVIWGSSSRGPTPNGRKKPDIAAPGTGILAPNNNWSTGSNFVSKTGTSMAAPHVGGAATLLHDVGVFNPRAVKAILINTADFIQGNTDWNNATGWGYMNLQRAYTQRANYFIHSVTPRNTAGEYRLYRVPNPQVGDKTTMVWHRRVNYNSASAPSTWYGLSDLNLRYYIETNNSAHRSSLSGPDNVEQVVSGTTQPLVIRAYAWSTSFSGVSSETYALAVPPGTVTATGPNVSPQSASTSYSPPLGAKFLVRVRVSNSGDLNAHNCNVSISLPSGVSLVSGSTSNNVGTVQSGSVSDYVDIWLRANTSGTKTVFMSATSNSYGIDSWSGSGSFTINPGPADTIPPYSVMHIPGATYRTGGTELIANGGFESNFAGWITSGATAIETTDPSSGIRNARLGSGTGSIYQTVNISSGASRAILSFDYQSSASFLAGVGCIIRDSSGNILVYPFSTSVSTFGGWATRVVDVSRFKGQTVQVYFYSSTGFLGGSSTLWLDNISLKEGETVWVNSASASMNILTRDNAAGVDYTQYAISGGAWTTGTSFNLPNQGQQSINYRSVDNSNNTEPTISTQVGLDSIPPLSVLRVGSPRIKTGGTEKVSNGGFESLLSGWTTSGTVSTTTDNPNSGSRAAVVEGGTLYQDVAVASGANRAFASAWVRTQFSSGFLASFRASIVDPSTGNTLDSGISGNYTSGWTRVVWDVSRFRGSTVRLLFSSGAFLSTPPTIWVDDVSLRENANVYVLPSTNLQIGSYDASGVDVFEHRLGTSGNFTPGQGFQIAASGQHTVQYRARDNMGHQETAIQTIINVDTSGPTGSLNINNGAAYTTSTSVTLNISASDPVGVESMRFRNAGGSYGSWVNYATTYPWVLTLGAGNKTVQVQFRDNLGNISGDISDSIQYLPASTVGTIGQAKLLGPQPVAVTLQDKVITGIHRASFYISETDRSSGIMVDPGTVNISPAVARQGTFEGVIGLNSDEEAVLYLTAYQQGPIVKELLPVGLTNSKLGGGPYGSYIPGISGSTGLHNTGLLVSTWGKVIWKSGNFLRIDDGSLSGSMLVYVDANLYPGTVPNVGDIVHVTGNLGTAKEGALVHPVIRVRNASSDIIVH